MNKPETYYDILQVSPQATLAEITLAYRNLKQLFHEHSLATYTLYSEEEIITINQQIEEAYAILSNSEARRNYDITHHIHPHPQQNRDKRTSASPQAKNIPVPHVVSGGILQNIRESQGVTLQHIADKTKISMAHLEAIEANQADAFPGMFYLKSYLKQYAACIGLDPCLTWEKYQENLRKR